MGTVLANDSTSWSFIPPHSPHFGGLWEAGIKSTKYHLRRMIGDQTLTFEEISAVLIEIEACLNSRPLEPLSGDIDDLQALTPAHFLCGGTSLLVPEAEPPKAPIARLNRYQLLERSKWRGITTNYAVGQLVVVQDERYPPSKWPLGRILEVHPGSDGCVRVVTVKTATTTLCRPIVKLSSLPSIQCEP